MPRTATAACFGAACFGAACPEVYAAVSFQPSHAGASPGGVPTLFLGDPGNPDTGSVTLQFNATGHVRAVIPGEMSMTNYPVTDRRPFGVTLLGVLTIIAGILYVISGLLAILASTSDSLSSSEKQAVLVIGIVVLVFGLIYVGVARGLFRGSNGARIVVAMVSVLTIVAGLYGAIAPGNQRGTSLGQVILAIVVLALLYSGRANEFFARHRRI